MSEWPIAAVFLAIALMYLATRNLFSYQMMFYWMSLPGILALPPRAAAVIAAGTLARAIGMLAGNRIFKFNPKRELARLRKAPLTSLFGSVPVGLYATGFVIVLATAVSVFYFTVVGVPLLAEEVGTARMLAKTATGSWIVMRFIRLVIPVMIFICYMHWRQKFSLSRYFRLAGLFMGVAFLLSATGFKGNVLMFLAVPGVILTGLISEKISLRLMVSLGLAAVVAAFIVTGAMAQTTDFRVIFDLLWNRLALESYNGLIYIVYYLVPTQGFQGGATFWSDFMSLLYKLHLVNAPVKNVAALIASTQLGRYYLGEQAGVYVEGELYLNFGMTGVVLGGAIVGTFLQALYVFTVRIGKDAVLLPFLVMLQLGIMMSLGSPFIPMVIDYVVSTTLAFLLLVFAYVFASVPFRQIKLRYPRRVLGLLWEGTRS